MAQLTLSTGALPRTGRAGAILTATVLAVAVGAVVAPSSLAPASIWGMLPLVAVLAIGFIGFLLDRVMLLIQRKVAWNE